MSRLFSKQAPKPVREFGKLGFVGTQKMEQPLITAFDFTEDKVHMENNLTIAQIAEYRKDGTVSWVNVGGLHDTALIHQIGEALELHPMVLDQITNTDARPRFEDYEEYAVMVLKMLHLDSSAWSIEAEHIVTVLYDNMVLTFQENEKDPFHPIRDRLKKDGSRVRKTKADYLAFSLIRAIINDYSIPLEQIGAKIEELETEIISTSNQEILEELNAHTLEINFMNKVVRPVREAVTNLCRSDSSLIRQAESQFMINHLMDSTYMVAEAAENYRMMLHDLLNIYHTNVANRLNEMFRVLTIFSVIFVPLTFVVGIYGMNFEVMHELSSPCGYYAILGVMISLAVGMLFYFRRKGWL